MRSAAPLAAAARALASRRPVRRFDAGRAPARLPRLSRALAVALVAVVALAPVPLASNRPLAWLGWAAVIFALAALWFGAHALFRARPPVPLRGFGAALPLAAGFAAYAFVQALAPPGTPVASTTPGPSLLAAIRWTSYAVFFALAVQVAADRRRAERLLFVLFVVAALHAIVALAAFRFLGNALVVVPSAAQADDVTGTFVSRNAFATFLGMGCAAGGALLIGALSGRSSAARPPAQGAAALRIATLAALLGFLLMALAGTGSRGGIAASLAGIAVAAEAMRRPGTPARRMAFALCLIPAAAAAFTLGIGQPDRFLALGPDGARRLALYRQVAELIAARPLSGHGLDSFSIAFQAVRQPPVDPDLVWSRAHSTYLALWSEAGLIAGSVPPVIVALLLARTLRAAPGRRVTAAAALGAGTVAGLHALADFGLEIEANALFFLALLALAQPGPDDGDRPDDGR